MVRALLIICVCLPAMILANSPSFLAEQAYKLKQYDKAIALYESALESMPQSPEILYNLGNAHFQRNELGKSKFYYLKAKQWIPRDTQIHHNISLINAKTVDKIKHTDTSPMDWIIGGLRSFTVTEVSWVFLLLLSGFSLGSIRYYQRRLTPLAQQLWLATGLFTLGSGLLLWVSWSDTFSNHHGVIVSAKVMVKSGPSSTLPTLFYVHDGLDCTILQKRDTWSEIKLNNGFKGWIKSDDIWIL